MQFLYDNLTASIIAVTTTLLIFSIQSQATQGNAARTARNVTKQQAQTFASWLEKDLGRVGANISQDERIPFEEPVTAQTEGGTRLTEKFTYYRDEVDSENDEETRIATRYQVEKVEDEPKDLYQLTRQTKEDGSGSWSDAEGRSSPTLGYFQVDMLDKDAGLVSSPNSSFDDVRMIRVRFSVLPPFDNEESVLGATHVGSFTLVRQDSGDFGTPGESGDDCNGEGDRDRGHGNDCDGFDEDNPGRSDGTG